MKRLLPLILIFMCIQTANAQWVNESQVTVKAVAVTTGEAHGVVINITALITPGNGKVFVSTSPFTQIDMQGSAQLAALTACDVLGMDFLSYNFFYTIEAEAPIVGGPSAGGVMTIATIAALKNLSISDSVFMTGMIYPDGSIGPVGGIPQKLEAAAKNNAEIFLIPKGQRTVVVYEKIVERKGPFIFKTIQAKSVDLVELGKELGVDVIEVNTIEEALAYYTGYSITNPKVSFNISEYSDILIKLADKMKKDAMDLLEEVKKYADGEELKNVMEIMINAEENYKRGNYYTSTSQYFSAKIEMRYILYKHTLTTDKLSNEFNAVEEEIDSCIDRLKSIETIGVNSFQLFGAAQERITIAEDYLAKAKTSRNFDDAIYNLAFARERIESARTWLSLLSTIKEDIPLNKEEIKRRAQFYLNQAKSLIVYASTIGGFEDLIELSQESAELSQRQLDEGFYSGAVTSAIDSIVKTSISIELIDADEKQIDEKASSARKSAEVALSEVEFITPVLPAAYFEYAETLDGAFEKLLYYKLSERLSKIILLLANENPERELIEVEEFPSYTKTTKNEIEVPSLEVPGFEVFLTIAASSMAIYIRRR